MSKSQVCKFPECGRQVRVKKWGLCGSHNVQRHRGLELTPLRGTRAGEELVKCPVDDCDRWEVSRGLCASHSSVAYNKSIPHSEVPRLFSGFKCPICGQSGGERHVDHDHSCCQGSYSCGKCIRGLVCSECNQVIKWVERVQDVVPEVLEYLDNPPGMDIQTTYKPILSDNHPGRVP